MAGMSPEEARRAREYLAEKAAQEEWTPRKPLDEYKDEQVLRKARAFQRQERAGLPLSNQDARGHGHSEGGKTPHLPAPKSAYDLARGAERAGVEVTFNQDTGSGKFISEIEGGENVERTIDFLTRAAPGTHLQIKFEGANGQWHLIYQKNGREVASLFAAFEASEYDTFEEWLTDETEDVYGAGAGAVYAGGSYAIVAVAH